MTKASAVSAGGVQDAQPGSASGSRSGTWDSSPVVRRCGLMPPLSGCGLRAGRFVRGSAGTKVMKGVAGEAVTAPCRAVDGHRAARPMSRSGNV
ncbi:hypothetical protein GCM10023220_38000 [Streptomyces ziwulingensis]|uniref:Uncharacterized protein n=1 Tax=Streptomyces ziwulingensis TaxID=1045501 RepID=A0ABP9C456_9ACTN